MIGYRNAGLESVDDIFRSVFRRGLSVVQITALVGVPIARINVGDAAPSLSAAHAVGLEAEHGPVTASTGAGRGLPTA